MNIITIDPHVIKDYAYSKWTNDTLIDFGTFKSMKEFRYMLDFADEVLIEDQFLGKNFNTAKLLTLNTGKVIGLCELCNVDTDIINVATWKSKMPELQQFDKDESLSSYRRKKAKEGIMINKAIEIINRYGFKGHSVNEDIASAVLIAWTMRIRGV